MKQTKLILGIAVSAVSLATSSMAAVFFETFDYGGSVPTVGTDASNLNGSFFQEGSWSGSSPLPSSSPTAHPGTPLAGSGELVNSQAGTIHLDRPTADAFIRGNFTRPLVLDGTQIDFDFAFSRTGNDHEKDVEVVGLDASNNEAFRLVMSARNTGGSGVGNARRVGYYTDGGTLLNWDVPGASDADGDISSNTAGQYAPAFSSIGIGLSPTGYSIGFARANAWRSSLLPYNQAAGDLVAIEFRFQGTGANDNFRSGFFLDNLYAGAKQVPEASTAGLLLLGIVGIRYGRKAFKKTVA